LDNLDSSQFLRSDANDVLGGVLHIIVILQDCNLEIHLITHICILVDGIVEPIVLLFQG
jgi:hypothetical protein